MDHTNLGSALAADPDGSFLLTEDVDTTADGDWTPIGDDITPFTGTFDGGGYTVTYDLASAGTNQGFFGVVGTGGTVQNVNLAGTLEGDTCTGSVAGVNRGTISGCSSSMDLSANGYNSTGGIAGENYGAIEDCSFTGTITQTTAAMVTDIGGIVGRGWGGRISRCYSTGVITASGTNSHFIGGIIGAANTPPVEIRECYAVGAIIGYRYVGGLVGGMNDGLIVDCYARGAVDGFVSVGGLLGGNSTSMVENCYATGTVAWASDGGFLIGVVGTAPTLSFDANPADPTYYLVTLGTAVPAGWDAAIWGRSASINDGYPYLLYFGADTVTP